MEHEIKETNGEGKETGTQINGLEQKEEIHIQPDSMKKQEFKQKWEAKELVGQL